MRHTDGQHEPGKRPKNAQDETKSGPKQIQDIHGPPAKKRTFCPLLFIQPVTAGPLLLELQERHIRCCSGFAPLGEAARYV